MTATRWARNFAHAAILGLLVSIGAFFGACTTTTPDVGSPIEAGLRCVDDSLACRNKRQAALEALLADKTRAWIRQPATAEAYASGVRLFAFKQRKRDMNCVELSLAQQEANAARSTLRAAANRLTPAQVARGALLGDEVGKELAREHRRRRCKA